MFRLFRKLKGFFKRKKELKPIIVEKEKKEKVRKKEKAMYSRGNGVFVCKEYTPEHHGYKGIVKHKISVVGKFENYENIASALLAFHNKFFTQIHEILFFYLTMVKKGRRKTTWVQVKRQPTSVRALNEMSMLQATSETLEYLERNKIPNLKKIRGEKKNE